MEPRNRRKSLKGEVISSKMKNTVIVEVTFDMRHPTLGKVVKRRKKFYAHDEKDTLVEGDVVEIMETRPLSKLKRWRVVQKLEA